MKTRNVRMIGAGALVLALAGVGATAVAQDTTPPPRYDRALEWAPTPVPDRIVLNTTENNATSQAVTWRTSAEVTTAQAQIAKMDAGPYFAYGGQSKYETVTATSNAPIAANLGYTAKFHSVTFKDLDPKTAYLYRVGDGTNWSEWQEFTTASDKAEPFSFIYYGDSQNDVKDHASRVFRRAFRDRPDAKMIIHAGDLVNTANRDHEWGWWNYASGWINGNINTMAVPGNHEYQSGKLTPVWSHQFENPKNGPAAVDAVAPESVYFTDYQGVRFIGLNTNLQNDKVAMQEQADFLDKALAENPGKWSVVTFHHPVFATASSRNHQNVRDFFLPIFEKHQVDLVLQGHDHNYARGGLTNANIGKSGISNGTVYVVSVSGPKMYQLNDGFNWRRNGAEQVARTEYKQLYQLIDVDGNEIRYEARTADGKLFDGFTITKNGKNKKVTNSAEAFGPSKKGPKFESEIEYKYQD
ncbi:purple acid phosphatase family protein [Kribbia dieselivorans]|uniref:purple acid phosphatase family protein n=1 Tax=Kribbia dieselivorans TaxID=331526 RepID=UPI0008399EE1|nr:metallophosphoesterase family protein [Kribbia dieselivorans]